MLTGNIILNNGFNIKTMLIIANFNTNEGVNRLWMLLVSVIVTLLFYLSIDNYLDIKHWLKMAHYRVLFNKHNDVYYIMHSIIHSL